MMTCFKDELADDELSHDPSCLPFCFSLFYTLVSPDTLLFSGTLLVVVICFVCSLSLCCSVLWPGVTLCFFLSHHLPIVLCSVLVSRSASSCHTICPLSCTLSLCHTLLLLVTPSSYCLVLCPCVTVLLVVTPSTHCLVLCLCVTLLLLIPSTHCVMLCPCVTLLLVVTPSTHCVMLCPCVTLCFFLSHPLSIVLCSVLVSHCFFSHPLHIVLCSVHVSHYASCCHTLCPLCSVLVSHTASRCHTLCPLSCALSVCHTASCCHTLCPLSYALSLCHTLLLVTLPFALCSVLVPHSVTVSCHHSYPLAVVLQPGCWIDDCVLHTESWTACRRRTERPSTARARRRRRVPRRKGRTTLTTVTHQVRERSGQPCRYPSHLTLWVIGCLLAWVVSGLYVCFPQRA